MHNVQENANEYVMYKKCIVHVVKRGGFFSIICGIAFQTAKTI